MTAAAVETRALPEERDTRAWIALLARVVASGATMTGPEEAGLRNALWRAQEAGDVLGLGQLKAFADELARRSADRMRRQMSTAVVDRVAEQLRHDQQRPVRWAALPATARALYLVADRMGGRHVDLGRALAEAADLLAVETGDAPPADTFEWDRLL
jgi:hypothetical protein